MNVDEYLNNLQTNLDDQLSRFGVSDQPAGNASNNDEPEEKKFCPECGNKVAADAKFCPECGYKFDAADDDAEDTDHESSDAEDTVATDYGPEELRQLFDNIYDAQRAFIEKAQERLKKLSQIAAEQHEQDFGWMSDEVPDNDEDAEAYEDFDESQFHVFRYDDFAYQTSEIIAIRFRLEEGSIVITAYYDDEDGEIVEDCELYFNYDFADNYRAVAFCIDVAERELGLK